MTNKEWSLAIEWLTKGIIEETKNLKFEVRDKTTNNYKEFVKENILSYIVVSREGSDKTIYGNSYINILARVWHDYIHLKYYKEFTEEDELFVAKIQRGEMFNTLMLLGADRTIAKNASDILFADIYEQVKYYYKHGKFVDDQLNFIKNKFVNSLD